MAPRPSDLRSVLGKLPRLGTGLRMAWSASPAAVAFWAAATLIQGLVPVGLAWGGRAAVNALAQVAHGASALDAAAGPVLAVALLLVLSQPLASLASYLRSAIAEDVQGLLLEQIHARAIQLDLAFFERPASYDLLHRARVDALQQSSALLDHLAGVARSGITVGGLALLVARYAAWAPLLLVAAALPGLVSAAAHIVREHAWRKAHTTDERRLRYWDHLLTGRESAAELRLFDLGGLFKAAHAELFGALKQGRLGLARHRLWGEVLAGLAALAGMALGVGWIVLRVAHGRANLGDVVLFYQVFQQAQAALRILLEGGSGLLRALLFVDDIETFLTHAPELAAPDQPVALPPGRGPALELDRVSFRYPGSERLALDDVSLALPPGRMVAVVGSNGAGKSTLVKLLCRFYDPERGAVRFGGVDLRQVAPAELWRRVTVLFQEPVKYAGTAAENIAFGDAEAQPSPERIAAAAEAAGADGPIRRLPQGYRTLLGKWLGGSDLSLGEWQRVALARAFLRDADVVVLDEPTSAMDSWAEADWMARFRALVAGRTTLVITHRFTTAMQADVIHVMQDGRVVESGTHEDLVAAGGMYAESWRLQMNGRDGQGRREMRAV
jgi:ATP-binding cassette subfamily B protein